MNQTYVTVTFRKGGEQTFMKVQSGMVAQGAFAIQYINATGETVTTVYPLDVVWSVETFEVSDTTN